MHPPISDMASCMIGVNGYWKQFSDRDIANGEHRGYVGGMWDEIGRLQFEWLVSEGLVPDHALIDVGCGALRGGVHFAGYLRSGNYCGIDVNVSLLEAGRRELALAGLSDKSVRLHATDRFDASVFGTSFDFGISVSLLTHLNANYIILCFAEVKKVMHSQSRVFFTFFEAPYPACLDPVDQGEGVVTHCTHDCYHYSWREISGFAEMAGLNAIYIGDWGHPRNQKMFEVRVA